MLFFGCPCGLCGEKPLYFPRLLVVVRLLQLIVLVFEECLELHREGLLFVVGCWLLCDCYDQSYWFSRNVLLGLLLFFLFGVLFTFLYDLYG